MTSDGWVNMVDLETLTPLTKPKKLHNMMIQNAAFLEDGNALVTCGLDYRYNFVPVSSFSALTEIKNLLMYMAIIILVLLYFVDYLV